MTASDINRLIPVSSQVDVRKRVAHLRYPETHEEEQVNLDELIKERCISVGEQPNGCELQPGQQMYVMQVSTPCLHLPNCPVERLQDVKYQYLHTSQSAGT